MKKTVLVTIPVEERHKRMLEKSMDAQFLYRTPSSCSDEELEQTDVLIGNIAPELVAKCTRLAWYQLNSAGIDGHVSKEILPENAIVTNASGAYGLAVAEAMFAMTMALQKKLYTYRDQQAEHVWQSAGAVSSFYGARVLIMGLGDIGKEYAMRAKAFGSYVTAVKRTAGSKPEYVDELYDMSHLDEQLQQADIIAMALPNTPATQGILSAERIKRLKANVLIVNGGRGTAIDQEALLAALESRSIGGAALDVTEPEPLPADHPLWNAPNLILTPHVAGGFHLQETFERIVRICAENLEHFSKGEKLIHQADLTKGY